MMKKTLLLLFSCMLLGLTPAWGQENNLKTFSQEKLMKYCWQYTKEFLDKDEKAFLVYTDTEEIYQVLKDGRLERYTSKYYLSDHVELVFNESKVGKVKSGRYIVVKYDGFMDLDHTLDAISYEILRLNDQRLTTEQHSKNLMRCTSIDDLISHPLNYLDDTPVIEEYKPTVKEIFATYENAQGVVFPQLQQAGEAQFKVEDNHYILKNDLFEAVFKKSDGTFWLRHFRSMGLLPEKDLFSIQLADGTEIPSSAMKLVSVEPKDLFPEEGAVKAALKLKGKALEAHFRYDNFDILWRAVLRDGSHYLRTELEVTSDKDVQMRGIVAMKYTVHNVDCIEFPHVVGNTRGSLIVTDRIFAGLETPMGINTVTVPRVKMIFPLQGFWSRQTTLKAGETWKVSSVVGMIAKDQPRRSFLAYSERERAVPWRRMPVYISWYELNIDRNNSKDYSGNMTSKQCKKVVKHWYKDFYKKYYQKVNAFVFDDGWDEYGTWTFNPNFPKGFQAADKEARKMRSGIGAWLGPVGGYGQSGEYRRDYWKEKGGMQLSNPAYYQTFLDACRSMMENYDFRFFKFDGISAQYSAVGPDEGARGEENAEAILSIEREVRKIKPDIFLNTTVGTWASPFWFQYTDAIWRQEADYMEIGDQGSDRERWITYRDHLVYKNFVKNSPLCPINTLMTHGFILTKYGDVSKDMDYDGIVRELRCAFACGSGMVELYSDYELMNSINKGALWKDLADCIQWQKENADVLPDIHWVGGNPWDGKKANIYGWAAWNGKKAVLTLRNPAAYEQTIELTLREALDIPAYIQTSITLSDAFGQSVLPGLQLKGAIDIDQKLTLTLPKSSVFVYNGVDHQGE